jgi:serpin B
VRDVGSFDGAGPGKLYRVAQAAWLAVARRRGAARSGQEQDMAGDPSAAAKEIDSWVAGRTGGHITKLVTAPEIQSSAVVLVDAVYMEAPWATAFDLGATAPAPFHVSSAMSVKVQMMSSSNTLMPSALTSASLEAVELPYKGGHLSALVLMPPLGTLGTFVAHLTSATIDGTVSALRKQWARVQLPKFSLRSSLQLDDVLSALGMGQAFSAGANFSNISPRSLELSFVVHDAQIKVSEQGTEASAASGGGMGATAVGPPPKLIVFNHPFVFMVRDNATGAITFMAQVTDPSTS